MAAVKLLLGVRTTTPNSLCLIELGFPELHCMISKRKIHFINAFTHNASGDEPLSLILELCRDAETPMYQKLHIAQEYVGDPEIESMHNLREKCLQQADSSTRSSTYLRMNPELTISDIYRNPGAYIPDYLRVAYSRFRLSSHRLRVETGRWSRIPRELRTCPCTEGVVQDEEHVLFHCELSSYIRETFGLTQIPMHEFFDTNYRSVCDLLFHVLELFE